MWLLRREEKGKEGGFVGVVCEGTGGVITKNRGERNVVTKK